MTTTMTATKRTPASRSTFKGRPGASRPRPGPNGLFGYELPGHIIRLPHITVVPFDRYPSSYTCVVVESRHAAYPVGTGVTCGISELLDGDLVVLPPCAEDGGL